MPRMTDREGLRWMSRMLKKIADEGTDDEVVRASRAVSNVGFELPVVGFELDLIEKYSGLQSRTDGGRE